MRKERPSVWQAKKRVVASKVAEAIGALLEGYGARFGVFIRLKGNIEILKKRYGKTSGGLLKEAK